MTGAPVDMGGGTVVPPGRAGAAPAREAPS